MIAIKITNFVKIIDNFANFGILGNIIVAIILVLWHFCAIRVGFLKLRLCIIYYVQLFLVRMNFFGIILGEALISFFL